jgi:hypothetical protein
MHSQLPTTLEAWIGGYLGPSYKVRLDDSTIIYEIYERAYEFFSAEQVTPRPADWSRFLTHLDGCGFWAWDEVYSSDDGTEGMTWYVTVELGSRSHTSRGLNMYPPGFVEFLRAMRGLLNGRQFA